MAFLRFTRDKRGYEHFYLVQPSQGRDRSTARVIYWFRTPPNVKVGREPFDDEIRRELETQNPHVTFDWHRILETPIPSADAEKWRERRRAERAARAARRGDVQQTPPAADVSQLEPIPDEDVAADSDAIDDEAVVDAPMHVLEAAAAAVASPLDSSVPPDLSVPATSNENAPVELRTIGSSEGSRRKRRRRRRRRGQSGSHGSGGSSPAGPAGVV